MDIRRVQAYSQSSVTLDTRGKFNWNFVSNNPIGSNDWMIHTEGGAFALFNDSVSGEFVKLVPDEKVIQKWRFSHWPKGKICFWIALIMMQMWTDFYYFYLLFVSFLSHLFFSIFFFSFSTSIPCHSSWSLSRGYLTHQRTSLVLTLVLFFCFRCLFPSHIDVQGRWGQSGASLETDGHPFRGLAKGTASLARECLW